MEAYCKTNGNDDKEQEQGETRYLRYAQCLQHKRHDSGGSVREDDRQETPVQKIPLQFIGFLRRLRFQRLSSFHYFSFFTTYTRIQITLTRISLRR